MELSSPKLKKLLIFHKGTFQTRKNKQIKILSEKKPYIFLKKSFSYILENATLIF